MHDLAATVNLSALDKVRIDFSVRLSYADGLQQVKDTLLKIAKSDPRILETPGLFVQLMELGDSQVEYVLRAYTNPIVAGLVRPSINEQIKTRIEQRTFSMPFPQVQIHGNPAWQLERAPLLPGDGKG